MSFALPLRSSDVHALGDDARKDDDNVAFLASLPLVEQGEWLARLRWVRMADRMAENELFDPAAGRFATFCAEWRALYEGRECTGEHVEVWREIRARWWSPDGEAREPLAALAFGQYLDALRDYTVPGLSIATLVEHDRMCLRLSGNLFQLLPYLRDAQRPAASMLGAVDQMMNNLRDLGEDTTHGLCLLPAEVLAAFGVTAGSLLDRSAIGTEGYRAMMRSWVDEHLASARRRAAGFLGQDDLHPSLTAMRDGCVARYERILRVLRQVDFDYVAFEREYWGTVEDLHASAG